jgi:hypothetical protein
MSNVGSNEGMPLISYSGYAETSIGSSTVTPQTAFAWYIQIRYHSSDLDLITSAVIESTPSIAAETGISTTSTTSTSVLTSTKGSSNSLPLGLGLGLGLPFGLALLALLLFFLRELRRYNNIRLSEGKRTIGVGVMPEEKIVKHVNVGHETAAVTRNELPQHQGAHEFPQNREAYELPQDHGAHEFPQNREAYELPQDQGAYEFLQNRGAYELPEVRD